MSFVAVDALAALHCCVQARDGVTLRLVIVGEFLHIFGDNVAVRLRCASEADGFAAGLLVNVAGLVESLERIGIGDIVLIAVFLPLAVHVGGFLVRELLGVNGIGGENQRAVEQAVDHDHHDRYDDDDRDQAVQNASE